MSVSLPQQMKDYIQKVATADSYGTPSDYIRDLVREDIERREQKKLEALLLEGLASGEPIPMTQAELQKLEREVRARVNKRAGKPHA